MAFDYKKEFKDIYRPPTKPTLIDMVPINYVAVEGKGDPNEEGGAYKQAIELLYGISFTIKMAPKTGVELEGYFPYVVPPLEGFWKLPTGTTLFDPTQKQNLTWLSCIRLPDFVTPDIFEWAQKEAEHKKKRSFEKTAFVTINEGLCVQCMHKGSYDDEPKTIAAMHTYAHGKGYLVVENNERMHHEIYLSDPRRVAPERLKTVIRLPVQN